MHGRKFGRRTGRFVAVVALIAGVSLGVAPVAVASDSSPAQVESPEPTPAASGNPTDDYQWDTVDPGREAAGDYQWD